MDSTIQQEKKDYWGDPTGEFETVDGGLKGTVGKINSALEDESTKELLEEAGINLTDVAGIVGDVNTVLDKTESANGNEVTVATKPAGLNLQNYENNYVRYYGAVGGDLSVNTGLKGSATLKITTPGTIPTEGEELILPTENTEIVRTGDYTNTITSGSVIGGVGGSAAAALGNIEVRGEATKEIDISSQVGYPAGTIVVTATGKIDAELDGKTSTTVEGSVTTNAAKDANLIGFMNGGFAAGIGGTATSTITDSTTLNIVGTDRDVLGGADEKPGEEDFLPELTTAINVMKGSKVNAIGVMGGGTAVTTLGGTANAEVGGTSTINVTNSTVLGMIGGGAAASVDVTGPAEYIMDGDPKGNDDKTADITGKQLEDWLNTKIPDNLTITATEAINGGTAESTTGDTYLNINGDSTVIAAIGGGMAAASHTYTYKNDGTATGGNTNNAWGSSNAKATTGRSHITVNLPNSQLKTGDGWSEISSAVGGFINGIKTNTTQADSLAALDGKGGVFGIFGGGVAVGHGSASAVLSGEDGAQATATTEGSDIKLNSGYAAAVFGGGAAVTDNNARATAKMTDTVNISTASGMQTVGLFGGGVAISMEGSTAATTSTKGKTEDGNVALSTAKTVNIENAGDTDGIFGGGMAIGNSLWKKKGNDAVSSVETSNITVEDGTVSNLDMYAFMTALRNDNPDTDEYPQWSVLGFNASGAMVDLKGIMDETSIAAGGLGLGMTGEARVDEANVTINGGKIVKDILGGGIAVDNMNGKGGAHVGTSKIYLNDGIVEGSVYAGGAVNGTTPTLIDKDTTDYADGTGYDASKTSSTVDKAYVYLNGTSVAGEISGEGYQISTEYDGGDTAYNPFKVENDTVSYTADYSNKKKPEEDSVGHSELNISGTNTLSALGAGKYTSDSKIHDFDEVNVEAGSVTKLDGETVKADSTALIDGGLITTDRTAQIDLNDLEVNVNDSAYKIASNAAKGSTFWTHEDQLAYDRTEKYAVLDSSAEDNGHYNVTMKTVAENAADAGAAAEEAYGVAGLKDAFANQLNTGWKDHEGAKGYFSATSSAGQYTLGGRGMLFGEDAAVTGNTASIARLMADNVMQRLSFTDDYVKDAGWVNEDGGIWAKYVHNKYETSGMSSSVGGIRSSTDYDGAIVGVDIAKNGNFQYGAAIHYGSGDGDGILSHNDYDAWGLALYASLKDEEAGTNLMADIGWLTTDNDIDGTVNGKSMSADRDVDAWTIGVRGEKEFVSGQNQIVPYVGLRYMSINPGAYSVYWGGEKFSSYDADNQNLWLLPIGVSLRNETVTGAGWRITPKLDLSYIWAFGDTDTNVNLDLGNSLYYDVMDDDSWLASLGIEATKDVWSFGVGYGYQKGDDTKNKTWFVNASYAF